MERAASPSASVDSFVKSARRLIVAQILVGFLAFGVAIWATLATANYQKFRDAARAAEEAARIASDEAKKSADASKRAKEEAEASKTDAQEAQLLAAQYMRLASVSRGVLQAQTPEQFTNAAREIELQIQDNPAADAAVYALLATAQFRSDQPDRRSSAIASIETAIRKNNDKLKILGADEIGALSSLDYNEAIYLDRLAYLCALYPNEVSAPLNGLESYPPAVRAALAGDGIIEAHVGLSNQCGPDAKSAVLSKIQQVSGARNDAPATEDLFKVQTIFYHIRDEADRAVAAGASDRLNAAGYKPAGVELVPTPYPAGVRYYYPEQREEARKISDMIKEAYGDQWSDEAFNIVLLKGFQGLPRDRVEVWLPSITELAEEVPPVSE